MTRNPKPRSRGVDFCHCAERLSTPSWRRALKLVACLPPPKETNRLASTDLVEVSLSPPGMPSSAAMVVLRLACSTNEMFRARETV